MKKKPIIKLRSLTKKFKELVAVDSVDLSISRGEIFGLLGPNGAGKSTIIKMLCTLLKPTRGTAEINGYDIEDDKQDVRKNIGVVFQDPSVDEELTALENLHFHGKLYSMDKELINRRINMLIDLVELKDKKDILVSKYSGGMKRRLEIARGLMHKPKILFLDEPTLGLDPQTRTRLWNYIKKLNIKEKITIILTTHYMDEADKLCDRVGIIDYGKIIALDKPGALKDNLKGDTVFLGTEKQKELMNLLAKEKSINKMTMHKKSIILHIKDGETKIPKIFRIADKNNIKINSVSLNKPTLEDVFLHFTGRMIREESGENFASKVRMVRRAHGR